MRRTYFYLPMLAMLSFAPAKMFGQAAVDAYVGFGAGHDSSTGQGIDNTTFNSCLPATGGVTCQGTPSLNGFFMNVGGDVLFKEKFGAGVEASFTPAKRDYGPLQYRQTFVDVNGIYEPISRKRWLLQLQGGIGAAKTSFSFTQSGCVATAVCSSSSQAVGTSNHFQVHLGVGLQYFVTDHIFIRPQFDYHYVPGFTDQFASTSVPMAMVNVGFSSGARH